MNTIVDSHAPVLGFFSIVLPKIAAHMPRKNMIRVKPMSVWNLVVPNVSMSSLENWLQQYTDPMQVVSATPGIAQLSHLLGNFSSIPIPYILVSTAVYALR